MRHKEGLSLQKALAAAHAIEATSEPENRTDPQERRAAMQRLSNTVGGAFVGVVFGLEAPLKRNIGSLEQWASDIQGINLRVTAARPALGDRGEDPFIFAVGASADCFTRVPGPNRSQWNAARIKTLLTRIRDQAVRDTPASEAFSWHARDVAQMSVQQRNHRLPALARYIIYYYYSLCITDSNGIAVLLSLVRGQRVMCLRLRVVSA